MEEMLLFSKNYETEAIHPLRPYFKKVMDFIGLNLKQINNKLGHRRAEHTFYIDSTQYGLCTEKTYLELIKVFGIGFILICLAVIIASYTIIRLRPKDILTKME